MLAVPGAPSPLPLVPVARCDCWLSHCVVAVYIKRRTLVNRRKLFFLVRAKKLQEAVDSNPAIGVWGNGMGRKALGDQKRKRALAVRYVEHEYQMIKQVAKPKPPSTWVREETVRLAARKLAREPRP
jgi:hypothetical protein